MTQNQEAVFKTIQEEYWQYLEELEKSGKSEIINESGRTQFYADIGLLCGIIFLSLRPKKFDIN